MSFLISRLSWAFGLLLLLTAVLECSGKRNKKGKKVTDLSYFAEDEFAVQKGLGDADFDLDPAVPRPMMNIPPPDPNNRTWLNTFGSGPLACNAVRDLYCGDEYIVETVNHPGYAPPFSSCDWNFNVQPNVAVDFLCEQLHVPCEFSNYMRVTFFDTGSTSWICTNPSYLAYLNQLLTVSNVRSYAYQLRLGHTVPGTRGIGFRCAVRGTGGTCRPGTTVPPTVPPTDPPTVPPQTGCGINPAAGRKGKIINGNFATPHEYPWQVALTIGNFFCGGTIINDRWIMTAAHCISGASASTTFVRTGCHVRNGDCDPARSVNLVRVHPSYDGNIRHDIGLLRLTNRIASFSDRVQPICLPTAEALSGRTKWVCGWGRTSDGGPTSSTLKEATITTQLDQTCRNLYGAVYLDSAMICASEGSGSTCNGDSGSFMGNTRNGVWEQDGIVSYGSSISCSGFLMGFTQVRTYVTWILNTIAANP